MTSNLCVYKWDKIPENGIKIAYSKKISLDSEFVITRHNSCYHCKQKNTIKTFYLRLLFLAAVFALTGQAQALIVKGSIRNMDKETTTAYYLLSNSYDILQVGKCAHLKLELGYNDCYTLTFSKRGCRSKQSQFLPLAVTYINAT